MSERNMFILIVIVLGLVIFNLMIYERKERDYSKTFTVGLSPKITGNE